MVPTGARISAGKSGKVARSLPASAVARVNWPPVSWMPSPLSPAKRTTAEFQLCARPPTAGGSSIRSTVAGPLRLRTGACF